jgi:hypothetical protein
MRVTRKRFKDASEPDSRGRYEYYYSGVIYRFVFPDCALVARRYDDAAEEASFLRVEQLPKRTPMTFNKIPYRAAQFRKAVTYLRNRERIKSISVLLPRGYVEIDLKKIAA